MTIVLDPQAVRDGWQYADSARAEVQDARRSTTEAAGHDLAELAATLTDAAGDLDGVLGVVLGVIAEHHAEVETCIADFEASDGNSAGEFHGLAR